MGVRSVVGRNVLFSLGHRCLVLCSFCVFWLPLFGTLSFRIGYRCLVLCSTAVWYSVLLYWAIQAGLLTPLTFARHRLGPLAAFTSGAYFLHNGRR